MDEDIDGQPLEDDIGEYDSLLASKLDKSSVPAGFVPSRWETVDPEQIEAQAMTTSKWEMSEHPEPLGGSEQRDDQDESPTGDDSQEGDYQSCDR